MTDWKEYFHDAFYFGANFAEQRQAERDRERPVRPIHGLHAGPAQAVFRDDQNQKEQA
jgi:hypothetical protein